MEPENIAIGVGGLALPGDLVIPQTPVGLVIFAHGSGSSRRSPRNMMVARALNDAGLATLLFDLLTEEESMDRANVFDIELLGGRLRRVTESMRSRPQTSELPVAYFGASTGAAAALVAAADLGELVRSVVSRGGRPDMAGGRLATVEAPTLLIVGSLDDVVLDLNRRAQRQLRCENKLEIVAGATHLFEEPGTLERVSDLARDWFLRWFSSD